MARHVTLSLPAGRLTCDRETRRISGVAVPYGPAARTMLGDITFSRGSLAYGPELSRIKLLIGHDTDRSVGYLLTAEEHDDGLHAKFAVAPGPAGDDALSQAAEHTRDALSVGVDLDDAVGEALWNSAPGDPPVPGAGILREVSLCALPAFDDARVTSVAATREEGTPMEPDPSTAATGTLTAAAAPPPSDAPSAVGLAPILNTYMAVPAAPRGGAHRDGRGLSLARLGQLWAAANRNPDDAELLKFALADIKTTDWGPTPPAYVSELAGLITVGRPLVDAFSVLPLPGKGQAYTYPTVVTPPDPALVNGEKLPIPTGPVVIDTVDVPVRTIAWGNDVSIQAMERSDPEFLTEWFSLCAEYYARTCDDLAYTSIAAASAPVASADAATALLDAVTRARAGGRPVNVIVASLGFRDAVVGTSTATTLPLSVADKIDQIVEDPNLAADTVVAGAKDAFTWREDSAAPARLQAVNISLLGYDLGIYGFVAYETRYPASVAVGTVTPGP